VSLIVLNSVGQHVRTLVQGSHAAGTHSATWDGRADDGRAVAAGVYLCRLEAGAQAATRKVVKVE
jgi:flagellar hook assembly protein FlgD